METEFKATPRTFEVKGVTLKDCGKIKLDQDEMVSFVTPEGRECDFTAKSWGFYLGPSVNGRLKNEGFKTALTANPDGRLYILAVEENKIDDFKDYLTSQAGVFLCWLDEWSQLT